MNTKHTFERTAKEEKKRISNLKQTTIEIKT